MSSPTLTSQEPPSSYSGIRRRFRRQCVSHRTAVAVPTGRWIRSPSAAGRPVPRRATMGLPNPALSARRYDRAGTSGHRSALCANINETYHHHHWVRAGLGTDRRLAASAFAVIPAALRSLQTGTGSSVRPAVFRQSVRELLRPTSCTSG